MRRDAPRPRRRTIRFSPRLVRLEGRQLLSADVLTYHGDNARTGADLQETALTPATVNAADFGKVGFLAVDGKVDAQPLYLSNVAIPGQGTHNVVYVATENDSVYAFDAQTGALLWQDSAHGGSQALLGPGETTVPDTDYHSGQITPIIGITSTPVIDPATGSLYVVAMSKATVAGTAVYYQRIHALNLQTGVDVVPPHAIDRAISFPGAGPGGDGTRVSFDPRQYSERAALTLSNGVIYTGWTSHADEAPYTGWVIGFRADNLGLASVLNVNPNGTPAASNAVVSSGGSFWNSGAGFAADASGNLFNISGNGPFDPSVGDYGDSYLRLSTANGLTVADYFTPHNQQVLTDQDLDLASSGLLLLPDIKDASGNPLQLAVGAGKEGTIYVVDRNDLGKFNATTDRVHQEIAGALGGAEFGSPAYFNGTVYFGAVGSHLRAFPIANGLLATSASSQSAESFGYPGTSPTVSADGIRGGIVWAAENGPTGVLHAYDANNLAVELYDSNQAGARDQFGAGNKFITPMVANGRVYVGTTDGVAVFGSLLPPVTSPPVTSPPVTSPPVIAPPVAAPPTVLIPAFPSRTFVVGGVDLLCSVGADATAGEGSLTYTWSVISRPPGSPTPSFGPVNGTNASKLIGAGIAAPGLYGFRVTITAPDGQSVTSDVAVVATLPRPSAAIPAFASPAPVVGKAVFLGVVGADQAFPESALTYTWTSIGVPRGASSPHFSSNATNGSKFVAVAFSKPGTYTFRVAIKDPFAQVATSDVTIVVGTRSRRRARA